MNADFFGYIGAVLISVLAIPQLMTTVVGRRTAGVSATSWALQAACAFTFLIYGIRIASGPQIVGNLLPVAGALAVLVATLGARDQLSTGRVALSMLFVCGYSALLLTSVPPLAVGGVAVLLATTCRLPQALESVQSLRCGRKTSVNKLTWILAILGMSAWMIYAVIAIDVPVILANIVGLTACFVVLGAEVLNSRASGSVEVRDQQVSVVNISGTRVGPR